MSVNSNDINKEQIRAHVIRHVAFEGLGNIKKYFEVNSIKYTETKLYNNEQLPVVNDFELLIIMGGPMGIYDDEEYPWLIQERQFIKGVVKQGIKVVGVCLGSQFLADYLACDVYMGPYKEIGWFPVRYNPEFYEWMIINSEKDASVLMDSYVFQWHGDTYTMPEDVIAIGSSEAGINQGFIVNNQLLSLQFHIEMTPETVKSIVSNGLDELTDMNVDHSYIQEKDDILNETKYFNKNYKFLVQLLDAFL